MTELNKIFERATKLFFNAARNGTEASGIGISFANGEYPKEAYHLIKNNFSNKLSISLVVRPVVIDILVEEKATNKVVFKGTLNYDEAEFKDYQQKSPSGSPGFLVLGAFRNCQFYIINPELVKSNFQPFQVEACHIHDNL